MKNLYPFKNNYLDLKGLSCHYLDEGKGEPLVMVHGNPTWSFYYRNLVMALRDKYRTIVPDHIGCGLSDKPDDSRYSYTFKQRADDLEALLDHLEIKENITLVLHDWGGMIGMVYASRYPERIKRLIIFNTGAFHLPKTKMFPWPLWISRNTRLGAYLIRRWGAFSWTASRVCCLQRPMRPEVRKAFESPYDSWENRIATLRFVQDIPLVPTDPGYELISEVQKGLHRFRGVPMLICWGLLDFVFDRHFLKEWLRHFPEAEVHRFWNGGHYILEDAFPEILPLVERFLRENPLTN